MGRLKDGESCGHPGCLSHLSHPCEECGRVGGSWERTANYYAHQLAAAEARAKKALYVLSQVPEIEGADRLWYGKGRRVTLQDVNEWIAEACELLEYDDTPALDAALEQAYENGKEYEREMMLTEMECGHPLAVSEETAGGDCAWCKSLEQARRETQQEVYDGYEFQMGKIEEVSPDMEPFDMGVAMYDAALDFGASEGAAEERERWLDAAKRAGYLNELLAIREAGEEADDAKRHDEGKYARAPL